MPYPTHLLPTTVVGSYPQPDWLVDRATLHHHGVPRAHAHDMWRVPDDLLEQAQDDATILAIREMERAGIDIVTDGEIRRESYSNRFALALEGIDADTPGELRTGTGRVTKVPRVVGPIRRVAGVETRDAEFLRDNATRATKITLPGPFTLSRQVQNDFYKDEEELAMDYAVAVNEELRALKATGVDVVQLDEPWVRTAPEQGDPLRGQGHQPGAGGDRRSDGRACLFRLRRRGCGKAQRLQLSGGTWRYDRAADLHRGGAAPAGPGRAARTGREDDHAGRAGSGRSVGRVRGDDRRPYSRRIALCGGRQAGRGAGLRNEVPQARDCLRQASIDGRRRGDGEARTGGIGGKASCRPRRCSW